jgi:hypothetical protein
MLIAVLLLPVLSHWVLSSLVDGVTFDMTMSSDYGRILSHAGLHPSPVDVPEQRLLALLWR